MSERLGFKMCGSKYRLLLTLTLIGVFCFGLLTPSFSQPVNPAIGPPLTQTPAVESGAAGQRPDSEENFWVTVGKNGGFAFVGSLCAAIIAFSGLIWATNRGYQNVIKAQKDAAELRRNERNEQVQFDTQTLALALLGEVTAIRARLEIHLNALKSMQEDWKDQVQTDEQLASDLITISSTPPISAAIYESNASRLGTLGVKTVELVVELYSRLIPRYAESTSPDGRIHVRHFMRFANIWIDNLNRDIEFTEAVKLALAVVAGTGDWLAVLKMQELGKKMIQAESEAKIKAEEKASSASTGQA